MAPVTVQEALRYADTHSIPRSGYHMFFLKASETKPLAEVKRMAEAATKRSAAKKLIIMQYDPPHVLSIEVKWKSKTQKRERPSRGETRRQKRK